MRSVLLVLALASAACIDLPEPSEFGAHVVVAADPGLELCGGSLVYMDEFVARLSAAFSLEPPTGDDRFTFYWLDADRFYERTICPREATACATGGDSYTPYAPINHELVHNVSAAFDFPRPFFTEGLAVAFEGLGDDTSSAIPPSFLPVRDLVGLTTSVQLIRAGGYETAGAFTTFLIREHGLDAYLRMFAAMGPLESERGIDRIFREEFGVSLDDSIAGFEAAFGDPPCGPLERDAKLLECAAPELEWEGERVVLHRSIACDQDDAVGPYANASVVVFRTVTIPEDGEYIVRVVGDHPRNRVSLQPCTICEGRGETIYPGDWQPIALTAGRHSLRLHGPTGVRTSIGLRIEPAPALPDLP